jgi:hypothetical protein
MDKETIFKKLINDLKSIKQKIERHTMIYNRTLKNYNQLAKHVYFTPDPKNNIKELLISDIHTTHVCKQHDKDCLRNLKLHVSRITNNPTYKPKIRASPQYGEEEKNENSKNTEMEGEEEEKGNSNINLEVINGKEDTKEDYNENREKKSKTDLLKLLRQKILDKNKKKTSNESKEDTGISSVVQSVQNNFKRKKK